MDRGNLMSFLAVSFAVIVVPGPSVLFVVGRALAAGRRAALLTVLGNASGVFVQVILVALGLGLVVARSEAAYAALKLAGAAYLVWLGLSAIRHRGSAAGSAEGASPPRTVRPWRDGFVVGVTNPKSLVFLAALLPQWVVPASGPVAAQTLVLGAVFCAIALVSDGTWAVLAARARTWFSNDPRRREWSSVAGGVVMVALGLLLALSG